MTGTGSAIVSTPAMAHSEPTSLPHTPTGLNFFGFLFLFELIQIWISRNHLHNILHMWIFQKGIPNYLFFFCWGRGEEDRGGGGLVKLWLLLVWFSYELWDNDGDRHWKCRQQIHNGTCQQREMVNRAFDRCRFVFVTDDEMKRAIVHILIYGLSSVWWKRNCNGNYGNLQGGGVGVEWGEVGLLYVRARTCSTVVHISNR